MMSDDKARVSLADLQAEAEELAMKVEPTKAPSLKEVVRSLRPQLVSLKDKGMLDREIAEWLTSKGYSISAGTLKNYMSTTKDNAASSTRKRPMNRQSSASERNATTPQTTPPKPSVDVEGSPNDPPGNTRSLTRNPRKPL